MREVAESKCSAWPVVRLACLVPILVGSIGAQLPPAIQIDRLLLQAERQSGNGDTAAAIDTFDQILELSRRHGLDVPAAFWFKDAQLAEQAEAYSRAVESVTRYLSLAGQDAPNYVEALQLLDQAEVSHRQQLEAEARRRAREEAARRRAEEAEARRGAEREAARRRAEEAEAQRRAQQARAQRAEVAWRQLETSFDVEDLESYVREFSGSAYDIAARARSVALRAPRADENGWTDLHFAAAVDLPDLVRHFVRRGGKVDAELKRDGRALSRGLARTLEQLGRNFRGWTRDGETPLHVAAVVGARAAAAALIAAGADVNRGTKFDWRPLHYAAWVGAVDVIEVLAANGAAVNARTDEVDQPGRTALGIALEFGNPEAAQALRARGGRR